MDYRALVDMAVLAGEIMLVSGAEVYRVEDTVSRILKHSGLEGIEVFALATGIFVTLSDPSIGAITVVKRVNKRATNLNRVYCVNDVSRHFCKGELGISEAEEELKRIAGMIQYSSWLKIAGYIITSAFFTVLFGGRVREFFIAALVGAVLALAVIGISKLRLNDFCVNGAASFIVAVTTLWSGVFLYPGLNTDAVIISAIMPLVPGVTFTSAIRDTLNGDYSSGVARIGEAVVVALAIASGVGAGIFAFSWVGGAL